MRFEDQRLLMIEKHLVPRGISNVELLASFAKVPRECFVDEKWKEYSYQDHPLQIECNQTTSQPFIIAYMMQLLDIKADDCILEIGTGSGYQTALLAELCKEVYTVERYGELSMQAREILRDLGYKNIYYKVGDGTKGWENSLPVKSDFDKIIVSAGSPNIPESLIKQLKIGGKLAIPIGDTLSQRIILLTKGEAENQIEELVPCTFVPLIGQEAWKE
ncbi:MAG TPA: protein-L-isoaspartate(D-aspartate) O-methyltransferase [Candidatus Cloacimonadota bacterium]|nr:protein-L-isoaspartate(D-aspartate) O-methyltransferase [Candidatus Cloacimonadota bacterium]HQB41826.1 protein-L-isoaspartate(D-aspartate) O-methyltransferase [Candidatus Cloacimonadota bacterium]